MTSISLHESALAATSVARRTYTSWLTTWRETSEIAARYWTGATARGATPLDVAAEGARWARLLANRRPPDWSTPNDVAAATPLAVLRRFGSARRGRPVLVLPPQAGHHSCIVDYSPGQSQVRTALAAGYRQVHVLEWLGATDETKDASIEDYLGVIMESIERIGGPVDLVGNCQGGWLATIYAALHPGDVATRTTQIAGGPKRFVLTSSGHIAGIVNPPGPKRKHWVNEALPADPDEWLGAATEVTGSWWEDWARWAAERGGAQRKPPEMGSQAHPPLEDAPGTYVRT